MIGASGSADAYPKVELPLRPKVHVDGRQEHVFLIAERVNIAERAVRPVVFNASRNPLQKVVAELEIRLELVPFLSRGPVERFPEGWIEPQVQLAELLIDN